MQQAVCLYKQIGETPLMCLNRLRQHDERFSDATLSYAGRLDPMAEGLLLVMVNDGNKRRDDFLNLDKTYTCEILFDVATDTYDVLGMVRDFVNRDNTVTEANIRSGLAGFVGVRDQQYPMYSSKPVRGKPLFRWAREGKGSDIAAPRKQVTVHSITLDGIETISRDEVRNRIFGKLAVVSGDFRQTDIAAAWDRYFSFITKETYQVAKITIACSSGTYVRMIADQLGRNMGTCALALNIRRTHIGSYCLSDAIL